jgi:hypothetical protein
MIFSHEDSPKELVCDDLRIASVHLRHLVVREKPPTHRAERRSQHDHTANNRYTPPTHPIIVWQWRAFRNSTELELTAIESLRAHQAKDHPQMLDLLNPCLADFIDDDIHSPEFLLSQHS